MKNFIFLFVALLSAVCLLGFSSCDKDDDGLAGTTWSGKFDTRDYGATNFYTVGTASFSFSTNTCNFREVSNWVQISPAESGSTDCTDTWYYDDTDYPTIIIYNNSGFYGSLYIKNNSFSYDMPGHTGANYQMTFTKK